MFPGIQFDQCEAPNDLPERRPSRSTSITESALVEFKRTKKTPEILCSHTNTNLLRKIRAIGQHLKSSSCDCQC
jgi:hypothetical protein